MTLKNVSYLSVGFFMALLHSVFQLLLLVHRPLQMIVGLPEHGLQLLHLNGPKVNRVRLIIYVYTILYWLSITSMELFNS